MASNTKKDYTQMHIKASEHPKAYSPYILILNIVMSVLGAIIGLELIVRTGVAPNTSIVGALFAIIISRLPIAFLKKYQSIHCQNMIQTSISGATFSAANCFLLPIGVPVIMGRILCILCLLVYFLQPSLMQQFFIRHLTAKCFRQKEHGLRELHLQNLSLQL